MRNAWITPSGSLKESNRETCKMIGLSRSMPNRSITAEISSWLSSRFFSLNGSIEGWMTYWGCGKFCEKLGIEKIEASYWLTASRKNLQTCRLGREASIWHRQIHLLAWERIC